MMQRMTCRWMEMRGEWCLQVRAIKLMRNELTNRTGCIVAALTH